MQTEPGVTSVGRRGLDLDGWSDVSVWGWDEQIGSLYAQPWRDRDDDDDSDADDRPEIWITPPTWEATDEPTVLAQWIALATGQPVIAVLNAMTGGSA